MFSCFGPPFFSEFSFAPGVDREIDRRNEKDGNYDGDGKTTDDGASQRCVLLRTGFESDGHGNHAEERGERGHEDGAEADFAGFDGGVAEGHALSVEDAGEFYDEDGVGDDDTGHHDDAHQRHDVKRAARHEQCENNARETGRNGHEDDEGIEERCELCHENEVNEQDGDDESEAEFPEGLIHADDSAAKTEHGVAGRVRFRDELLHLCADALQGFGAGGDVDIDNATNLVMVHFSRCVDEMNAGDGTERSVAGAVGAHPLVGVGVSGLEGILERAVPDRTNAAHRDAFKVLHGHVLNPAIGILHGHHIVVAALWVDPVAGRDHPVGSQGGDDVVHHVFGREAD